jgi:bacterioferritin
VSVGSFTTEVAAIRIIRWLGDADPTTRRFPEDILADEEEHADDIVDLLGT